MWKTVRELISYENKYFGFCYKEKITQKQYIIFLIFISLELNFMKLSNLEVMKKIISFLFFMLLTSYAYSQLPYSKMLAYDAAELTDNKFKYDKNKNQYVLNKSNGLNNFSNVMNSISGATADIRPHRDDYRVTIQYGNGGPSYLQALFYNDDTFHNLEAWMTENGVDVIETNSGKNIVQKFNYDNYEVTLTIDRVGVTTTTDRTSALAKNIDESYNVYTYTIFTGIEPSSKWHDKEAAKKEKNAAKGKKKDLDDLF